jgi:osmotically inducible protein OsmC
MRGQRVHAMHVMKPYSRKASVLWLGSGLRGRGAINTPSSLLRMALYGSGGNINRRGTNPTELIAAAQAGSFSLTLANELGEAGFNPRQIDTTATITMENIAASWTMTQIHLDVVATVPKVAQCDFVDAALRAKANCPVSRALNANISMQAKLTDRAIYNQPRRTPVPRGSDLSRKNGARRKGGNN